MNAAGRMATASDVIELFLTEDRGRARELAEQLHALNQERQQAETAIVERILEECARTPVTSGERALVFSGPDWHRGVVGIVASRLVERFHRPAVVLGEDPETGLAQGSGRSIPEFHLLRALESMSDLLVQFGGHRQAAGVTLEIQRVPEFRERLNAFACGCLSEEDLAPVLEIDARLELEEVNDRTVEEIFSLAPFGFGNPLPVFAVLGAEVAGAPVIMKERHLRFNIRQAGRTIPVKAWNFAPRIEEMRNGACIDVALHFEQDAYSARRGCEPWSAVVREVRRHQEPTS
jgi:single-stranded-DNA-specific exonuclease